MCYSGVERGYDKHQSGRGLGTAPRSDLWGVQGGTIRGPTDHRRWNQQSKSDGSWCWSPKTCPNPGIAKSVHRTVSSLLARFLPAPALRSIMPTVHYQLTTTNNCMMTDTQHPKKPMQSPFHATAASIELQDAHNSRASDQPVEEDVSDGLRIYRCGGVTVCPILLLWGATVCELCTRNSTQYTFLYAGRSACAGWGCGHGPCMPHCPCHVTWVVGPCGCWAVPQGQQLAAAHLHPQGLPLWALQSGRRGPLPLCQVSVAHVHSWCARCWSCSWSSSGCGVPCLSCCRPATPTALSSMLSSGRRSLSRMISTRDQSTKDT